MLFHANFLSTINRKWPQSFCNILSVIRWWVPCCRLLMLCMLPLEKSEAAQHRKEPLKWFWTSILGKVSYFLLFEMTISFGLNSFWRKNLTDWSPRTACCTKCHFEFQTIQTESMHTPAGVFEGDIKSTEEQGTNNMLLAGNPEGGSSQSNGLMESSLTSLTVVQVGTRSFFQT